MKTKGNNLETIPAELAAALKAAGLETFFADCTAAHRREYLQWIGSAKKPQTRLARSCQAVKMLETKRAQAARTHKK
jgi:uncharacterized protein YdeI (YjbR/CyaY-like superfamily)